MKDPDLDELMGRFRREAEAALGGWEFGSELRERVWQRLAVPSGPHAAGPHPLPRAWYARPGLLAGVTVAAAIGIALLVVGPPDALAPYLHGRAAKSEPQAATSAPAPSSAPSAGPRAPAVPERGGTERSAAPMVAQDMAVPGAAAAPVPAPARESGAEDGAAAQGVAGETTPGGAGAATLRVQGSGAGSASVGAAGASEVAPEAGATVQVKYSAQVTVAPAGETPRAGRPVRLAVTLRAVTDLPALTVTGRLETFEGPVSLPEGRVPQGLKAGEQTAVSLDWDARLPSSRAPAPPGDYPVSVRVLVSGSEVGRAESVLRLAPLREDGASRAGPARYAAYRPVFGRSGPAVY
ncbi:COG1361 family protein [Caldinitratiruptor microaerophilus]|uniref:Uncharacterized protein n=1 Tax=Caldinitratiruptor microaerophilus TaxID=671077 RepID=A0AA35G957_9FIRM|nr:hypothetical protein [Caldinitratiruptor microaerophilus]BDG61098.1 hypothetical protein caldi_21880 [Caldinitratiruptor microaerophilus]